MGATVGSAGQRPAARQVNARSNLAAAVARAPATLAAMSGDRRSCVVEDDEAIASGLVRVLDSQGYAVRRLARGGARAGRGRRRTSAW